MANALRMKYTNGASGSRERLWRNWPSSIPKTPTARHPSPISGRGQFNVKVQDVGQKCQWLIKCGLRKRVVPLTPMCFLNLITKILIYILSKILLTKISLQVRHGRVQLHAHAVVIQHQSKVSVNKGALKAFLYVWWEWFFLFLVVQSDDFVSR